jgi:hypothetical protein
MILNNITAVTSKERVSNESDNCINFVGKTVHGEQTGSDSGNDFHPNFKYAGVI